MSNNPLDFKRGLKSIWTEVIQGKKPSLEGLDALTVKSAYRNCDPLTEVLAHLTLKSTGQIAPPLIPRVSPMPVAELCQLVLLWAIAGEYEAASALSRSIPLDFPWMWCPENAFREDETIRSLALLKRSLHDESEEIQGGDPYFQSLANSLSRLPPVTSAPVLDWFSIQTEKLKCALTFCGFHTSLGAILSKYSEVRAFGPQGFPLSNSRGFGLRPIAQHGNFWASPIACPEVWFNVKAFPDKQSIVLELSFLGLKPSHPLAFSFYVKADSAQIEGEKLKSGTLQRYQGVAKPLLFGGDLMIESLIPAKLEVIPLAGGGGYWDCEYLAAFEIHPVTAKAAFLIRN